MIRRLGWYCFIGGLLLFLGAVALQCVPQCLKTASLPLLLGAVLGFALALVTRSQNAFVIYFGLGLTLLAGTLFMLPLPTDIYTKLTLWKNAPPLLRSYPEIVRAMAFLLAIPYPFARFGYHAPDYHYTPEQEPHND